MADSQTETTVQPLISEMLNRPCMRDASHGISVAVIPLPDCAQSIHVCGPCAEVAVSRLMFVWYYEEPKTEAERRQNKLISEKHRRLRGDDLLPCPCGQRATMSGLCEWCDRRERKRRYDLRFRQTA